MAVEKNATVLITYLNTNDGMVDNYSGSIENAYTKSGIENKGNVNSVELPSDKNLEDEKNNAMKKYNAVAIVSNEYQSSLEAAFTKALSLENAVMDIVSDIDLSSTKWNPIDMEAVTSMASLKINGNNHTISGMNIHMAATNDPKGGHQEGASNYYGSGFIGRVGQNQILTINDLSFTNAHIDDSDLNASSYSHTSGVAVVTGISYGKTILNNVNVSNSTVYGGEKVSGFVGFSTNSDLTINGGSLTNTTITCTYYYSALVVGMASATIKPTINNIRIAGCTSNYDSNTHYASKSIYVTEDGDTYVYLDDIWMRACYKFALVERGGYNETTVTYNGITARANGHSYDFVQNGDLYSIK